jgi:hypothetical protein
MKTEHDITAFSRMVRVKAGILAPQELARLERAEIVKATYRIEEMGVGLFHVQHPTEDVREYLVDIAAGACDCPDFQCRGNPEHFRCKHLLAMQELTGCVLPQDTRRAEAKAMDVSFSVSMAEIDMDDPYKD